MVIWSPTLPPVVESSGVGVGKKVSSGFCPTTRRLVICHSLAVSWTTVDRFAQSSWPAQLCIENQLDQRIGKCLLKAIKQSVTQLIFLLATMTTMQW